MEKSQERLEILARIEEYEKAGKWDCDVENDPPAKVLMPNKVDYLNKKLTSKILSKIANKQAIKFYENMISNKQMIIKEIKGIENYLAVKGGAVLTCNHFHICDNYAVFKTISPYLNKHNLYKVIKEGNFTSMTGIIGTFFRHCNTLPLSSNMETMKKFMSAVKTLLDREEKILIYPEQAMWWNYRKPRPLKNGAFRFAVTCNVPIIPFFITMEDTDVIDNEGFPVQAYTINIMPAIYPKAEYKKNENMDYLKNENYRVWKECYEDFYKIPLTYNE